MIIRTGQASTLTTSITIPSHQAGNIIVISASRNNSTPPTVPAGWVTQVATGASGLSNAIAWKMAKSSSETSGIFANASVLQCSVYEANEGILVVSSAAGGQAATSATINYATVVNGLSFRSGVLSNWYIGTAFQLNSTNALETAPTGMANVLVDSSAGLWKSAYHDGQQLSNWSATNVGPLATSAAYIARVIQLFEFAGPVFGVGGGVFDPLNHPLIN